MIDMSLALSLSLSLTDIPRHMMKTGRECVDKLVCINYLTDKKLPNGTQVKTCAYLQMVVSKHHIHPALRSRLPVPSSMPHRPFPLPSLSYQQLAYPVASRHLMNTDRTLSALTVFTGHGRNCSLDLRCSCAQPESSGVRHLPSR